MANLPGTVSRENRTADRTALLVREKELSRERDTLDKAGDRRAMAD